MFDINLRSFGCTFRLLNLLRLSSISLLNLFLCLFSINVYAQEIASIAGSGVVGNNTSTRCQISNFGNFVAFDSLATNLSTTSTTAGIRQIYLRDRTNATTQLLSINKLRTAGGDSNSHFPSLSPDGRFIVFHSSATNLINGDTNGFSDVFIIDRNLSGGALRVSFGEDAVGLAQGNNNSWYADISDNGRYVVFLTEADNLIATDSDVYADIYVRDLVGNTIQRISQPSSLSQPNENSFAGSPAISGNGEYIVFGSYASNLVSGDTNSNSDVFVHNRISGSKEIISLPPQGESFAASDTALAMGPDSISADGRFVGFGVDSDFDAFPDKLYIRDRTAGITIALSKNEQGQAADSYTDYLRFSSNAQFVTFSSPASNLLPLATSGGTFLLSRASGKLSLMAGPASGEPCISPDARWLGFHNLDSQSKQQIYVTQIDQCPADSNKLDPGVCGCGTADTDSDGDGTPDCNDSCVQDGLKLSPGICGCGTSDIDSDRDGTPDCDDQCSGDGLKRSPGICGCGVSDSDQDGDGTVDCQDLCPLNSAKITAGYCGCAKSDKDNNKDIIPDCFQKGSSVYLPDPRLKTISGRSLYYRLLDLGNKNVRYIFTLENLDSKKIRTYQSKKPAGILKKIAQGNYIFRYRLFSNLKNKKKPAESRWSKPYKFSVSKSKKVVL